MNGQARCKKCITMKECTLCELCWRWWCEVDWNTHSCKGGIQWDKQVD